MLAVVSLAEVACAAAITTARQLTPNAKLRMFMFGVLHVFNLEDAASRYVRGSAAILPYALRFRKVPDRRRANWLSVRLGQNRQFVMFRARVGVGPHTGLCLAPRHAAGDRRKRTLTQVFHQPDNGDNRLRLFVKIPVYKGSLAYLTAKSLHTLIEISRWPRIDADAVLILIGFDARNIDLLTAAHGEIADAF